MRWVFAFFLVSGFCSILYELIRLRLSMAQFGVTTALVSIVLSTFMAGLGLGSWLSGRLIRKYGGRLSISALWLYAAMEFFIGVSALLVPHELSVGRTLFEQWGLSSSFSYYLASGIWVALSLAPWCACMGATIPVAMLSICRVQRIDAPRSFSYLYLANVLGAVAGSVVPLLFIELYGFHTTLKIAAALNFLLAVSAFTLSLTRKALEQRAADAQSTPIAGHSDSHNRKTLILLFATGLTSMGMEVAWIRLFTPYLGTMVYAFAAILCTYLLATFLGSALYRRWSRDSRTVPVLIWSLLGLSALLPVITARAGLSLHGSLRVVFGLMPFSGILGFVTPMLVDRWSDGDPDRAGRAYAINVVGCILGPLLSGFFLLPWIGERWGLAALAMPWFLLSLFPQWLSKDAGPRRRLGPQETVALAALAAGLVVMLTSKDYAEKFATHKILRDSTATVIATGEGAQRQLLVNGVGITYLTPITKMMAHLPLAFCLGLLITR
ncbi:MAG TPA: hypothetical protein VEV40_11210 [Alloacidobacterium sp.]|nr:hypothetical protein [Alloacidobacterium sp.]